MNRRLSQDEIDALVIPGAARAGAEQPASVQTEVVAPYNFRRPDRISKEQKSRGIEVAR